MSLRTLAISAKYDARTWRCSFASPAIVLTEVPPVTVPTVKVVFGSAGVRSSPIFAIARPIAWIALAVPNASKLWPPGPVKVIS